MSPEPCHHCSDHRQPTYGLGEVLPHARQNIIHAHLHFHKRDSNSCHPSRTQKPPVLPLLPLPSGPHARLQAAFSAAQSQARPLPSAAASSNRRTSPGNRRMRPARRFTSVGYLTLNSGPNLFIVGALNSRPPGQSIHGGLYLTWKGYTCLRSPIPLIRPPRHATTGSSSSCWLFLVLFSHSQAPAQSKKLPMKPPFAN